MTSERIKEIQEQTAYPESVSVMVALKQVWNECEQEQLDLHDVSDCQLEAYVTFCIECDRQGLKPIKYSDYLQNCG